jgi:glycosyltransferase involved in cell wall biosynthesis
MKPVRVVVVGQTPPPHHGQAIAIDSFVNGRYERLELVHVRMAFSGDIAEVGGFRVRKVIHLLSVIARILWARVRCGAAVLYYPPAGPDAIPVLRDMAILLATRWAFAQTVFHFHAAGLADIYGRLPRAGRAAFRRAYFHPDLAITPAPFTPQDADFLHARRTRIVPNGISDSPFVHSGDRAGSRDRPVVLYVGAVRESKGVLDLLDAVAKLKDAGLSCEVQVVGAFAERSFEHEARARVERLGLQDDVRFLGVRLGQEKDRTFADADIFCYPTYFEAETFGIVVVEAMRAGLPVVATSWRGVPSLIEQGETGFVVPAHDAVALADRIAVLIVDADLRAKMGRAGRERFLANYTEARFRSEMEAALLTVQVP